MTGGLSRSEKYETIVVGNIGKRLKYLRYPVQKIADVLLSNDLPEMQGFNAAVITKELIGGHEVYILTGIKANKQTRDKLRELSLTEDVVKDAKTKLERRGHALE